MFEFDYQKEKKKDRLVTVILLVAAMLLAFYALNAQDKYIVHCNPQLLISSEKIMLAQVGVKEKTGHNDGVEVEQYLASVGLSKGNPYCAAGQYWCFHESCFYLKLPLQDIPIARTGLANGIYNGAKNDGVKVSYKANRHDLIVWKLHEKSTGHIERIYQSSVGGNVYCVGFNTGLNVRDGQGVAKTKRNIYHPIGRLQVRGLVGFHG